MLQGENNMHRTSGITRNPLTTLFAALAMLVSIAAPRIAHADGVACPTVPEPHIPQAAAPLNIDLVKKQLRAYHDKDYDADLSATFAVAQSYVESRAAAVEKPAVVLDIDETSLTNWQNLDLDDFGFIKNGACTRQAGFPCGFNSWIGLGKATAIEPARKFFDAVRAKHVSVFFITGRRDSQRRITRINLRRAGYHGWSELVTRDDNDKNPSIIPYKSGARATIAKHYFVIATIGDQQSDIDGGSAECGFKVPNPFYFIP
jgi:predicted secreted acid phosphatase